MCQIEGFGERKHREILIEFSVWVVNVRMLTRLAFDLIRFFLFLIFFLSFSPILIRLVSSR